MRRPRKAVLIVALALALTSIVVYAQLSQRQRPDAQLAVAAGNVAQPAVAAESAAQPAVAAGNAVQPAVAAGSAAQPAVAAGSAAQPAVAAGNVAQPAVAAGSAASDWSMEVTPKTTIDILYRGAPVVTAEFVFWGSKYAWGDARAKCEPAGPGQWKITGGISGLKTKVSGTALAPAPNVIQIDLVLDAEQSMPDVVGGGWHWTFKLDSPALPGRAANPELLPGNAGWTWPVGPGQAITLRFDGGAAKVYAERGQMNSLRTFLVADRLDAGTHRYRVTLELPEGARRRLSPDERYDLVDSRQWFSGALAPNAAPVDLSFLNRDDRPAGRRGFVRADGDRLVFADGTPARFWGGNLAAGAIFNNRQGASLNAMRQEIARHARRMAQLGYNLMRIHHHDSDWANPNIFGRKAASTRQLDPKSLDDLDWLVKCLRDEGIYVWLDMHVGRVIHPADGLTEGAADIVKNKGSVKDFCYYNDQLQDLMKEFQHNYLNHQNRYTKLRYKDDPAVIAVLITNEDDLMHHGGNTMLPDHKNPYHGALWTKGYEAFARKYRLPAARVFQTWAPGPSKLYLAEVEHQFNVEMIADLRQLGLKVPIATTNFWGNDPLFAVTPLTDGDVIDVHSYGRSEEMGKNAHYQGNYVSYIAMGQVYGKPLSITEWNAEYPNPDRFTAPLYVASIASLQGWDAPMIYNYSQGEFSDNPRPEVWSTYHDPALTAIMPAAALLFRQGHVSPAKNTYCFRPEPSALFDRAIMPDSSATIRTLAEQSKLTIGMPVVPQLPWLKPSRPSPDVTIVTDPDRDFIPAGQSFVRSDTGELTRDWEQGIQTIDTPRTQAVSGWIGGKTLKTRDASFETRTKKAVIALSSVDNRPLTESSFILVTAVARAIPSPGNRPPLLSEPVTTRIALRNTTADLELMVMGRDGRVAARPRLQRTGDVVTFDLPSAGGTHWYILKSRGGSAGGSSAAATGERSARPER